MTDSSFVDPRNYLRLTTNFQSLQLGYFDFNPSTNTDSTPSGPWHHHHDILLSLLSSCSSSLRELDLYLLTNEDRSIDFSPNTDTGELWSRIEETFSRSHEIQRWTNLEICYVTLIFTSDSARDLSKESIIIAIQDRLGKIFSSQDQHGVLRFRTVVYREKSDLSSVIRKREGDYGLDTNWDGIGEGCCFCDGLEKWKKVLGHVAPQS